METSRKIYEYLKVDLYHNYMKRYEYAQIIIAAFAAGKKIQCRDSGPNYWYAIASLDRIRIDSLDNPQAYRVEPEDTYREWTLADVPPVCWIRKKGEGLEYLVTKRGTNYVYYVSAPNSIVLEFSVSYNSLLAYYDYKDNSGEWKPCKIKC